MYSAYAIQSTENKRVQWYKGEKKEENEKQLLRIKARTEHLLGMSPRSFALVESLHMHKHFKASVSPNLLIAACQSSTTITCMNSTKKSLKIHTGLACDCP